MWTLTRGRFAPGTPPTPSTNVDRRLGGPRTGLEAAKKRLPVTEVEARSFGLPAHVYSLRITKAVPVLRHSSYTMILSRDWVTIDGVWIFNQIYWARNYNNSHNSQFTAARTHFFSLLCHQWLSGNGFYRRRFLSFRLQRLLSSLADAYLTTRLGVATQGLTTMVASPPPRLHQGATLYAAQSFSGPSPAGLMTMFAVSDSRVP
jgi:hypothetical protein